MNRVLLPFFNYMQIIQMVNRKLSYFFDLVNWLECLMYVMALLYTRAEKLHTEGE